MEEELYEMEDPRKLDKYIGLQWRERLEAVGYSFWPGWPANEEIKPNGHRRAQFSGLIDSGFLITALRRLEGRE